MPVFFPTKEVYDKYYTCDFFPLEHWQLEKNPSLGIGLLYIIPGVFFVILYIPIIFTMIEKEFLKHSCYKIMVYLICVDIITLLFNSILTGIFTILGSIYCEHKLLMFISGQIAFFGWIDGCFTVVVLAFNRCLDLLAPTIAEKIFGNKKVYLWLSCITIYSVCCSLLTSKVIYNSKLNAWFFDPYFGVDVSDKIIKADYTNWVHSINNIVEMVLLGVLYLSICIVISVKYNKSKTFGMSSVQKHLFIQAGLICLANFIASTVYVYMQFYSVGVDIVVLGQFMWILSHGSGSVIYVVFNRSVRNRMIEKYLNFCLKRSNKRNIINISMAKRAAVSKN